MKTQTVVARWTLNRLKTYSRSLRRRVTKWNLGIFCPICGDLCYYCDKGDQKHLQYITSLKTQQSLVDRELFRRTLDGDKEVHKACKEEAHQA